MTGSPLDVRRREISDALQAVRERIDQACVAAGRPTDVDLLVVTKTFPAADVDILAELGVTDVGENRDQEASAKRDVVRSSELTWHMIGRLQSNKAASVARWADVVESVDRASVIPRLATGAERAMAQRGGPVRVLIQVNLDDPVAPQRGGAPVDQIPQIAEAIDAFPGVLELRGVMAVAPHPATGVEPRWAFDRLYEAYEELRSERPQLDTISAGMSGDLEAAIAAGATQVRIGGAILGQRPVVQ